MSIYLTLTIQISTKYTSQVLRYKVLEVVLETFRFQHRERPLVTERVAMGERHLEHL